MFSTSGEPVAPEDPSDQPPELIAAVCPHCSHLRGYNHEWRGLEIQCLACSKKFELPCKDDPASVAAFRGFKSKLAWRHKTTGGLLLAAFGFFVLSKALPEFGGTLTGTLFLLSLASAVVADVAVGRCPACGRYFGMFSRGRGTVRYSNPCALEKAAGYNS
jgi:hypothetical protein